MRLLFTFVLVLIGVITYSQESIRIGNIKNSIVMGPLSGNRELSFGVQNILEEVLQEKGYILDPQSQKVVTLEIIYFDVRKTSVQLSIYGKSVEVTEIVAQGKLYLNDKELNVAIVKGQSKSISTSTLIIDNGGKFSQSDVSSSIKKLCEQLIEKLKL
jgi:metal-responsive CopG/Arc/MetJ family transcriptional regulator